MYVDQTGASAALDALAECEIYRRFSELTAGKTTLFISPLFARDARQALTMVTSCLISQWEPHEIKILILLMRKITDGL